MKNHSKSILAVTLLLVITIATICVGNAYAAYGKTETIKSTATSANWVFTAAAGNIDTTDITITSSARATKLAEDRIAPGTSGYFTLTIKNATGETGVDYSIEIPGGTKLPSAMIFKYNGTVINEKKLVGQLKAGDETGKTIRIDWEWPYDADGNNDNSFAGKTISVPIKVTGTQIEPNMTAMPVATVTIAD